MKAYFLLGPTLVLMSMAHAQDLVVPFPETNASSVTSLGVAGDGERLVVGGRYDTLGGQPRDRLGVVDLASYQVLPFSSTFNGDVEAVVVDGNTVFVFGGFTLANNQVRNRAAAFDLQTGALLPWDPNVAGTVYSACKVGNTIYMAGDIVAVGLVGRERVAAVDATTGALLPFAPLANSTVYTIRHYDGKIYLGGIFSQITGQERHSLAEVDATTGAVSALAPFVNGNVREIIRRDNTLFVIGGFTVVGDSARPHIAAIDITSGISPAWGPAAGGTSSMELVGDSLYVAGVFFGQTYTTIVRVDPITGAASPWSAAAILPSVLDMVVSDSLLVAGGLFNAIGAVPKNCLAAFEFAYSLDTDEDGIPDASDDCPLVFGTVGFPCDDGNSATFGDSLGPACTCVGISVLTQLTTAPDPVISCGASNLILGESQLYAVPVPGATRYQFNFTNVAGQPAYSRNIASSTRALALNQWATLPLKPGRSYRVKVRVSFDGGATYQAFGPVCNIHVGYPASLRAPDPTLVDDRTELGIVLPNPVVGDNCTLNHGALVNYTGSVTIRLSDMLGGVVHQHQFIGDGTGALHIQLPVELRNGPYVIEAITNEARFVVRFVVAR